MAYNFWIGDHPDAGEIESARQRLELLIPLARHILDCPVCREKLFAALRAIAEVSGPDLWEKKGLSRSTANALCRANIMTLEALRRCNPEEIPGIGKVRVAEIRQILEQDGDAGTTWGD